MITRTLNLLGGFLLLLALPLPAVSHARRPTQKTPPLVLEMEYGIRNRAVNAPLPEYPEEARAARAEGLVIVAVHFEVGGGYAGAEVLASPHPAISRAVTATIGTWRLKPSYTIYGEAVRIQGELRFNYVIAGDKYEVELLPKDKQKKHSPQYKEFEKQFRHMWKEQEPEERSHEGRTF
jgi:TonB family protein